MARLGHIPMVKLWSDTVISSAEMLFQNGNFFLTPAPKPFKPWRMRIDIVSCNLTLSVATLVIFSVLQEMVLAER